jgi:hypothetical protein
MGSHAFSHRIPSEDASGTPRAEVENRVVHYAMNRDRLTIHTPPLVALRAAVMGTLLFSVLGIDCIKRGPFGAEEQNTEDHTFLIELKNTTRVPVAFKETGTNLSFIVQGTDEGFIRRTAEPGQVLRFAASLEFFVSDPVSCTYFPPSETTPIRRVEWNGNDLRCHFWD